MHHPLTRDLKSEIVAVILLALLRVVRRYLGEATDKFNFDSPRIEAEVFSVIPSKRIDEYRMFAEQLLNEEYPDSLLGYCPDCETHSVIAGYCGICFEEMVSFECPYCGVEDFTPSREGQLNREEKKICPYCGKTDLT